MITRTGATLRDGGELSDLAPTVLDLLELAAAGAHDRGISYSLLKIAEKALQTSYPHQIYKRIPAIYSGHIVAPTA